MSLFISYYDHTEWRNLILLLHRSHFVCSKSISAAKLVSDIGESLYESSTNSRSITEYQFGKYRGRWKHWKLTCQNCPPKPLTGMPSPFILCGQHLPTGQRPMPFLSTWSSTRSKYRITPHRRTEELYTSLTMCLLSCPVLFLYSHIKFAYAN